MNTNYRKPLANFGLDYFDAQKAVDDLSPGAYAKLPYTSKVLAEQLVRRCDPAMLDASLRQLIERKQDLDFPWYPARVLRDAIAEQGGDPSKVNPVVPTQLIVDHSLAVEHGGFEADAFDKNRAIEDRRNDDRFHFIEWTKTAFENVDVIPAGNGIMHQINLEKMSPVIQNRDGIAFPDTCVGTDSHTPHIDALGVIAVGVGGLEAENVMLGRASMMRLPDIVGVELTGKRQPGITATDMVLAITEFLRQQKVVSCYLEFFGEGADSLTIGDRATISNMTPEFGASAGLFYIDQQTLDYLTLTGREPEQVALVEAYAKTCGLWSQDMQGVQYDRKLSFDLSSVGRNMAGPSSPHLRLPTADLSKRGIAKDYQRNEDSALMPDGAVIIAAITSCTNTSNPRNVIAAGLLARNANKLGLKRKPWVKTSFAPGSKVAKLYLEEAGLLKEMEKLGFGIVGYACTTCKSPLYDWRPNTTYIRRPPYWEGALAGERSLTRMRPLAILGDNITTDHLSPSNAILATSAAGEYLAKMGLPEEDFNSYATHRGDHLTAQRATFANPKLLNEMCKNAQGEVIQGSLARLEPEGHTVRMWEAIETYMDRSQPLIIIAGADYGQGSSRDWAAKGVRLAGVEVIVAEGFERIHRTNLVGMGVLPLQFKDGDTRISVGIDGTESFDVLGEPSPGCDLTLVINRIDGTQQSLSVTCRLDTEEEVGVYAGPRARRFAASGVR